MANAVDLTNASVRLAVAQLDKAFRDFNDALPGCMYPITYTLCVRDRESWERHELKGDRTPEGHILQELAGYGFGDIMRHGCYYLDANAIEYDEQKLGLAAIALAKACTEARLFLGADIDLLEEACVYTGATTPVPFPTVIDNAFSKKLKSALAGIAFSYEEHKRWQGIRRLAAA